jgi:drug/metabolite transporter (DMT)-like permease
MAREFVTLVLVLLLSVLMNAVSQLSLKRGVKEIAAVDGKKLARPAALRPILGNTFIIIWLALLVPSMLLWLIALSMADLSFAYPFQSLSLVFIALGSTVFLKERVMVRQWGGIALILLGIFLISRT